MPYRLTPRHSAECEAIILRHGQSGQTPEHGYTVHCPLCGGAMVWDAPSFLTQKMFVFDCGGELRGEPKPNDWPRWAPGEAP